MKAKKIINLDEFENIFIGGHGNDVQGTHFGINTTYKNIYLSFYTNNLVSLILIEEKIRTCKKCQPKKI